MTQGTNNPGGGWDSTLWSVVRQAGEGSSSEARDALGQLARTYWKPVYFFIRRRCGNAEEAKDLTQSYFAYLMEKDLLSKARPEAGSFRAYLRGILSRFLSDDFDRRKALKRGGGVDRIPLDFAEAETDFQYAPARVESPEEAYDRAWSEMTLSRIMMQFREECLANGKKVHYNVFQLRFDAREGGLTYPAIAERLKISETDVTNYLHRALTRIRELFEKTVQNGVSTRKDLDEEIRFFGKNL